MKKYFQVEIDECSRNSLRELETRFNTIIQKFETTEEVKNFLIQRYGKIPNNRRKIYRDDESKPIGFLYSFWNRDYSHNSKNWFQTDWIVIVEIQQEGKYLLKL